MNARCWTVGYRRLGATLVACGSLLATWLVVEDAHAVKVCDAPYSADKPPLEGSASMDYQLASFYCENGKWTDAYKDHYYGLGLHRYGPWDVQLGIDGAPSSSCDLLGASVRLMNADVAALQVRLSASSVLEFPILHQLLWHQDFQSMIHELNAFGYKNLGCNIKKTNGATIIASNPAGKEPIELYGTFFFWCDGYKRGAVLLHEAIHEHVAHLPKDQATCSYAPSCDTRYGDYNAQTYGMYFLGNSVGAFKRMNSKSLDMTPRIFNYGAGECGLLPLLTPAVRYAAAKEIESKYYGAFVKAPLSAPLHMIVSPTLPGAPGSYGGMAFFTDNFARWKCDSPCQVSDFAPGGKYHCDEERTTENVPINQANRLACLDAQEKVALGLSPKELGTLAKSLEASRVPCSTKVDEGYVKAYCDGLMAKLPYSTPIDALVSAWKLADVPGVFDSDKALRQCVGRYCAGKNMAPSYTDGHATCFVDGAADDAWGCMRYFCDDIEALKTKHGTKSEPVYASALCRRSFLRDGVPTDGGGSNVATDSHCDVLYRQCREKANYEAWRDAGECVLIPTGTSGAGSVGYEFKALSLLGTSPSLTSLKVDLGFSRTEGDGFMSGLMDACAVEFSTCKAALPVTGKVLGALAKLALEPKPGPPSGLQHMRLAPFDARAADLLRAAAPGGRSTGWAARQVMETGETLHAAKRFVGADLFFAVMGAGPRGLFSAEELSRFVGGPVDGARMADAPAALQSEVSQLVGIRRRTSGAAAFGALQARLSTLPAETKFEALKTLLTTEDAGVIDDVLTRTLGMPRP